MFKRQISIILLILVVVGMSFGAAKKTTAPLSKKDIVNQRVEILLKRMTLDEKIGQMTQAERGAIKDEYDIQKYFLGSILSGGGSSPAQNNPQNWFDMVEHFQGFAMKTRLGIPLLYGLDAVHGNNNVYTSTIFPHNIGMGCTRNPELVEKAARVTALEILGSGAIWNFAPCVAVARDERWGRTYESYSEDPALVSEMGAAAIKGYQGADLQDRFTVLATAKHYLADGGTKGGVDRGDAIASEEEVRKIYLPPYEAAIKAGVRSIMVSFSSLNGEKMHSNQNLLTKVLKEELGFDGFVVSDWNGIEDLKGDPSVQIANAINAGIDMAMVPNSYAKFFDTTKKLVQDGKIPMTRIDDAVRRILRVKLEMNLFERAYADPSLMRKIGSKEHRAVARECVRQSVVLLKNRNKILPLSKKAKKIIVAGKSADDIGIQCGGWTMTWQGSSGEITPGTTILQAVKGAVSKDTVVTYSPTGNEAKGADAAIVVIGEYPYAEGKGDRNNLELESEDKNAIDNLRRDGVPVVVVLISGRPMIINPELDKSDAFLAAWLPGTEGEGVADVLFGDYKPTGKLSFSWPRYMSQIPVNVGDRDYNPLFEFGYGLSY